MARMNRRGFFASLVALFVARKIPSTPALNQNQIANRIAFAESTPETFFGGASVGNYATVTWQRIYDDDCGAFSDLTTHFRRAEHEHILKDILQSNSLKADAPDAGTSTSEKRLSS